MRQVSLSNLKALLAVSLWLGIWLILLNLALFLASQTPALAWLPDRQTGVGFALDNQERVIGAEREYRAGQIGAGKRLGAVVGISNTREAIDLDTLNRDLGGIYRFIGLAGAGASATYIVDNARFLLNSNLKPDLVVVGITPPLMLDSLATGNFDAPRPSLRDKIKASVKPAIWLSARRKDVSVSTERGLLALRSYLFELAGVHLPTADTASPWRSMLRLMGADHYPARVLIDQLATIRSAGGLEIKSFQEAHETPEMLGRMISEFTRRGARVIVVLTPENSALRSREPRRVAQVIETKLKQGSRNPNLEVIDYRAAVDDSGLVDLTHMNEAGSKRFTKMLVDYLRAFPSAPTRGRIGNFSGQNSEYVPSPKRLASGVLAKLTCRRGSSVASLKHRCL